MEAVIGDTQQDSCLLSPKEKREVRGYGGIWTMEKERGNMKVR